MATETHCFFDVNGNIYCKEIVVTTTPAAPRMVARPSPSKAPLSPHDQCLVDCNNKHPTNDAAFVNCYDANCAKLKTPTPPVAGPRAGRFFARRR